MRKDNKTEVTMNHTRLDSVIQILFNKENFLFHTHTYQHNRKIGAVYRKTHVSKHSRLKKEIN